MMKISQSTFSECHSKQTKPHKLLTEKKNVFNMKLILLMFLLISYSKKNIKIL